MFFLCDIGFPYHVAGIVASLVFEARVSNQVHSLQVSRNDTMLPMTRNALICTG